LKTSRLLKIGLISNKSSYKNDDRTTQKVRGRLEGESMKAFTRKSRDCNDFEKKLDTTTEWQYQPFKTG